MAQGIKRLGMPIAAFLGVALIGLVATSWLLNRDALRAAVEAQIRAVTGLDLVVKGATEISVFPASYVAFHDVGLRGRLRAAPQSGRLNAQPTAASSRRATGAGFENSIASSSTLPRCSIIKSRA